jgi:ketosteroid isomerase-like protein
MPFSHVNPVRWTWLKSRARVCLAMALMTPVVWGWAATLSESDATSSALKAEATQAMALARNGQPAKAIATLKQLAAKYPDSLIIYNNLGVLYASLGQLEDARKSLEAGLAVSAEVNVLQRNLDQVRRQISKDAYARSLQISRPATNPVYLTALPLSELAPSAMTTLKLAQATTTTESGNRPAENPMTSTSVATSAPAPAPAPESRPVPASDSPIFAPPISAPPTVTAELKVQPKPVEQSRPTEPLSERDAVKSAVMSWAKSWADKELPTYLDAYSQKFEPGGKLTRAAWEAERKLRIEGKKYIRVDVQNLRVLIQGSTAQLSFTQNYESDYFSRTSRKTMIMVKEGNRWLILRESVN